MVWTRFAIPAIVLAFCLWGGPVPSFAATADKKTDDQKTISELVAERNQRQTELDALGKQYDQNQEQEANLRKELDALRTNIPVLQGRKAKRQAEVEKERAKPLPPNTRIAESDKARARSDELFEKADDLYNIYDPRCPEGFPPERQAECDVLFDSYSAMFDRYQAAFDQYLAAEDAVSTEQDKLEAARKRAVEAAQAKVTEVEKTTAESKTRQDEAERTLAAFKRSTEGIVEQGRSMNDRVKALEGMILRRMDLGEFPGFAELPKGSPCNPGDFRTAEAYEICVRCIYGECPGRLDRDRTPVSPWDMDPSVVKPDRK